MAGRYVSQQRVEDCFRQLSAQVWEGNCEKFTVFGYSEMRRYSQVLDALQVATDLRTWDANFERLILARGGGAVGNGKGGRKTVSFATNWWSNTRLKEYATRHLVATGLTARSLPFQGRAHGQLVLTTVGMRLPRMTLMTF